DGHVTDWEGRAQRMRPVRGSLGLARPDWEILTALGEAAGAGPGFSTLDELHQEMGSLLAPRDVDVKVERPQARAGRTAPEGLRLFSYPLLVDEGTQVEGAEALKAALGQDTFCELHPADAGRLGVVDGATARISTEAGAAEVPVRVTEDVAEGSIFVPFNQPGLAANELLSGSFVTSATVEAAGAERAPAGEPAAAAAAEAS
ncbi:MAG: hypothetical protein M3O84_08295, partial [Actinomycetota bacterium]|nr:hypothetical protein [Actinomycetota bacterium]